MRQFDSATFYSYVYTWCCRPLGCIFLSSTFIYRWKSCRKCILDCNAIYVDEKLMTWERSTHYFIQKARPFFRLANVVRALKSPDPPVWGAHFLKCLVRLKSGLREGKNMRTKGGCLQQESATCTPELIIKVFIIFTNEFMGYLLLSVENKNSLVGKTP